ncbi:DUF86 domain-containing protein [bacterium]|nr:DUF86 domain-containing protein [bacterium]
MINKELINRKLFLIAEDLERLREFTSLSFDEIAKDPVKHGATERYLERIIGRAIDINQHIIAEKGNAATPVLTYHDTFLSLTGFGVYPKEFAEKIAKSAGLRNILVHEYDDVDPRMFEESMGKAIEEFNAYSEYIHVYTEKENG